MQGFFKVDQRGGSYVVAQFYNPDTGETRSECVRDYDYGDCSRDKDDLYDMLPAHPFRYEDMTYDESVSCRPIRVYKDANARLTLADFFAKLKINYG